MEFSLPHQQRRISAARARGGNLPRRHPGPVRRQCVRNGADDSTRSARHACPRVRVVIAVFRANKRMFFKEEL